MSQHNSSFDSALADPLDEATIAEIIDTVIHAWFTSFDAYPICEQCPLAAFSDAETGPVAEAIIAEQHDPVPPHGNALDSRDIATPMASPSGSVEAASKLIANGQKSCLETVIRESLLRHYHAAADPAKKGGKISPNERQQDAMIAVDESSVASETGAAAQSVIPACYPARPNMHRSPTQPVKTGPDIER